MSKEGRSTYKRCEVRTMPLAGGGLAYGVFESPSQFARMLSMGWWYTEMEAWDSVTM